MLGKKLAHKSLTLFVAVAVWCVFSSIGAYAQSGVMGEISVTGQVSVNGQSAVSNSTLVTGSTIVTGSNSTATISLGKNGRVELLSDTTVTLKFTDNSIVGMLSVGKVRVSNASGIGTTVTTKNATVIADAGQANTFSVDVGCGNDEKCSQTFVETTTGLAILRTGNTDKQVAAGTDAVAGNPSQTGCQPCARPNSAPPVAIAGPWWLILLAGAAAGTAIALGGKNETETGGGVVVVSPVR